MGGHQQPRTRTEPAELGAAVAELRRLLMATAPATSALYLDAALRARFITWSTHDQGNTRQWVREQELNLAWWAKRLVDVELRTVALRTHVLPALEDAEGRPIKGRKARLCVLKRFYSWLVDVRHELDPHENPVASMRLPQTRPAQWKRSKVVPPAILAATRAQLSHYWRPILDVLCGTAWHVTEVALFARDGVVHEPTPLERRQRVAGVLETRHKGGAPKRTAVSARALQAALRLRKRGGMSVSHFNRALRSAAQRAGVEPWGPGRMRHTVSTYALERGATWQGVADFLQHADKRTTKRWYAVNVAPPKVPTLL